MAITRIISRNGETRKITINGNAGAKFELYVKADFLEKIEVVPTCPSYIVIVEEKLSA